jgi:Trypsin-co-occurring domain 2
MSDVIAVGLAETIRALRGELISAMKSGADEPLHFELGPVQLEVTLAITREGSGDAGVRFGVVSFGAKGDLKDATTHHLTLSLQPVVKGASGPARHAEISGRSHNEPQ